MKILKLASIFVQAISLINISLSPKENQIFAILKDVVKQKTPESVLRVAGGWVRDHLLGKPSNDIDISIDNMSGEKFAYLVKQYLDENNIKSGEINVVKANPEQSKHLATAMINILGQPIDFVQLRSESYIENSRIPTNIRPGTPQEDASRRDLTINSLFYNINTGEVEDFVGGIEDLKNGIARTPLDPYQTFKDDPLRILRTIRFAAKFNLNLDSKLIEAAKSPEIQKALKDKISKERVWSELAWKSDEKGQPKPAALTGPDPEKAARLIGELGVRDTLFNLTPEELESAGLTGELVNFESSQKNPHHDLSLWDHTLKVIKNLVNSASEDIRADVKRYAIRQLGALFHDIGKRLTSTQQTNEFGHTTYHGHEDVSEKLAELILNKLGAPKDVIEKVKTLSREHMRPHALAEGGNAKSIRRLVRDVGELYPDLIELSKADAMGKIKTEEGTEDKYTNLLKKIEEMKTEMGGQTKPIRPINGNDLMELGISPGPKMGEVFRVLDEELLNNPQMSKDEAIEFVRKLI